MARDTSAQFLREAVQSRHSERKRLPATKRTGLFERSLLISGIGDGTLQDDSFWHANVCACGFQQAVRMLLSSVSLNSIALAGESALLLQASVHMLAISNGLQCETCILRAVSSATEAACLTVMLASGRRKSGLP